MSEQNSREITAADCRLHYLCFDAQQSKESIILLHGMKFQAATWQELGTLDILAKNGYQGLALDMPGFGKSPQCAEEQDTVLDGFIDQVELTDKPILIGPSMGGRIALEYAIRHQEKIKALILVGAVGVAENKDHLDKISIPTLLVWGSEDAISPPQNSDILLQGIHGSKRVFIEKAPHPCYLDQPDVWHTTLLDFLGEL